MMRSRRVLSHRSLTVTSVLMALALVGSGCGGDSDDSAGAGSSTTAAATGASSTSGKKQASLEQLLENEKNVKCTFSSQDNGVATSGTTYIADERMYGDFTTVAEGKTTKSYLLNDGTWQYMWSDESKQGTKMKADAGDDITTTTVKGATTSTTAKGGLDLPVDDSAPYEFDCSKWKVDESLLKAPSNIEFTDLAALTQSLSGAVADKKALCAAISDVDLRAACESAG